MRMLRIAVLTALLVATTATPAYATTYTFITSCRDSTGDITSVAAMPYAEQSYVISHTITPCTPPSPYDVYAVVIYHAGGTAWGVPVVYPPPTATTVSIELGLGPEAVAVCLLAAQKTSRITCASLVVDAAGLWTLGPDVPVDAPIVSVPVTIWPALMQAPELPNCPTCMT